MRTFRAPLFLVAATLLCSISFANTDIQLKATWSVKHHTKPVFFVRALSDGKRIVSLGTDGKINLIRIKNGSLIKSLKYTFNSFSNPIFSPNERFMITGHSEFSSLIDIWDLKTGTHVYKIVLLNQIKRVLFAPNSNLLAISSDEGESYVIALQPGEKGSNVRLRYSYRPGSNDPRPKDNINHTLFSPDSKWFVMAPEFSKTAMIVDCKTGEASPVKHSTYAHKATISSDSRFLLTASTDHEPGRKAGEIAITDLKTSPVKTKFIYHNMDVGHIQFSKDSSFAIATWEDWDDKLPLKELHKRKRYGNLSIIHLPTLKETYKNLMHPVSLIDISNNSKDIVFMGRKHITFFNAKEQSFFSFHNASGYNLSFPGISYHSSGNYVSYKSYKKTGTGHVINWVNLKTTEKRSFMIPAGQESLISRYLHPFMKDRLWVAWKGPREQHVHIFSGLNASKATEFDLKNGLLKVFNHAYICTEHPNNTLRIISAKTKKVGTYTLPSNSLALLQVRYTVDSKAMILSYSQGKIEKIDLGGLK